MKPALDAHVLDHIERCQWVDVAAPVTRLDALARELGLGALFVKRDDLLPALGGGSKVRKLDFLLATEPYRSARGWHSVGAVGSGHLVALSAAAELLKKDLHAHVFRTRLSAHALANLAFTATHSARLYDERSRLRLFRKPALLLGGRIAGLPVVPPGTSNARGTLGMVRAGLELGEDIRAGRLEAPDRIYIALGSAGSAVGLAIGCALAGLSCEIRAVAVVERPLVTRRRLQGLIEETLAELQRLRVTLPSGFAPCPITIVRSELGAGYTRPTVAGARAGALFAAHGIPTESAYTEKALAALLADAKSHPGGRVLFWNTRRGALPVPDPGWKERLPASLRQYTDAPSRGRRQLLVGAVGVAVAALTVTRIRLEPLSGWRGARLSAGEARVLHAVAEIVLPAGADLERTLLGSDTYLATLPEAVQSEFGLLLQALEQAPPFLGASFQRFSAASPAERDATLRTLSRLGGTFVAAYRGVRDLCFIGYYQQEQAWVALGYQGPIVGPSNAAPSLLVAPAGMLPANAERSRE